MAKFISCPVTSAQPVRINLENICAIQRVSATVITFFMESGKSVAFTTASDSTGATYQKYLDAVDKVLDPMNLPYAPVTVDFTAADVAIS